MKNLFLIVLSAICIFTLSCKKTKNPVANFSFDGTSKRAPQTVQFTNTSTDATEYAWDFGDGGSSTEQSPKHQYKNGGSFTVSLTAKNKNGDSNIQTKQMIVLSAPISIKSSSITVNSLSGASDSTYFYFRIDGASYSNFGGTSFPQLINFTVGGISTPYASTPLSKSISIELYQTSGWSVGYKIASFSFVPQDKIIIGVDDAYPTKVNFSDSSINFDMTLEWY